jgi:hypothetical protein
MPRTIRSYLSSILVLSVAAGLLAFGQTGAAAQDGKLEVEGEIIGSNPLSSDIGGTTENAFLAFCEEPPNQGVDGWVVALPEGFGSGAGTVEVSGTDFTGAHDLDLWFYDAECSGTGSIATEAPDEAGVIPKGTAWVVIDSWIGVDTLFKLKATGLAGAGGPNIVPKLRLRASDDRIVHGEKIKLTGNVVNCSGSPVDIYSADPVHGVRLLRQVEPSDEGTFSLKVSPNLNTRYVAEIGDGGECPALRSKRRAVLVEPKIRIGKVAWGDFVRGRVLPNQRLTTARLQRRAAKGWNTVDKDQLNADSQFRLEFPSSHGRYRVLWKSDTSHMARTTRGV